MVNDEICGAVVSVRYQEDIISIWNRTANDQTTTIRIRDTLKRVLNLPPNTIIEYKVIFVTQLDITSMAHQLMISLFIFLQYNATLLGFYRSMQTR